MEKKIILVPHDFTSVADNALQHAICVAKSADAEIHVLHIVGKEKEIKDAEEKVKDICAFR
jgi:nucleotide-binding universal stress UspA family protein